MMLWIKTNATALLAALCVAIGATGAWWIQSLRLEASQARYDGFVAQVKANGEAAQREALRTVKADKQRKDQADEENRRTIDSLRADVKRLRDANPAGGGLSAPAPATESPTRTCFDPSKLSAALRSLDEEILGIVESGSEAVIDLDTAKRWGSSIMTERQTR